MLSNRQMEIFMSVYEEGTMTGAARKIHMSQPAISQTIKEIEKLYGTHIFERYGSRLHVTQAGKLIYNYSKRIINLYHDLDEAIMLNEGVREIRVGGNISAGTAQMVNLVEKFKEIYPDIDVKVMIFQAPVLLKAIQENKLDIALIEDQKKQAKYGDLVTIPYYKDRISIIVPNDHPLAGKTVEFSDIVNETFLFRERGAGVRDMFDSILNLKGIGVKVGWESTSSDALTDAVKRGMGIAVLPYLLVKNSLDSGEVSEVILSDISLSRNLNITYHKDKVLTGPLLDFIEIVKQQA